MQHAEVHHRPPAGVVSILTRPERRMQLHCWLSWRTMPPRFNPHPPQEADATPLVSCVRNTGIPCFNPHPPREADATYILASIRVHQVVSILTRPERRMQRRRAGCCHAPARFNPHPPREADATPSPTTRRSPNATRFNPHPPREADATADRRADGSEDRVSILIRPERRMQPPGPDLSPASHRFNPHPPREADATPRSPRTAGQAQGFNPHPPREADAT